MIFANHIVVYKFALHAYNTFKTLFTCRSKVLRMIWGRTIFSQFSILHEKKILLKNFLENLLENFTYNLIRLRRLSVSESVCASARKK